MASFCALCFETGLSGEPYSTVLPLFQGFSQKGASLLVPPILSRRGSASELFYREPVDTFVEVGKSTEEVMVFDTETDAINYKLALAQEPIP